MCLYERTVHDRQGMISGGTSSSSDFDRDRRIAMRWASIRAADPGTVNIQKLSRCFERRLIDQHDHGSAANVL
jgi:hypothetical protein